ncbi:hypothetical protein BRO03_11005 [Xanthomonas oryzae pv. oryzae]|nr:hypothetical protein BRO09_12535 [Xanthomonas oryzae pv. oryzae]RBB06935.1 hypothetical protein BRN97_24235 [Xanthomonas oryzae pv. oryzae]RBB10920.1 hypothetical protein BRO12_11655 [Xanthomonas oryzae pv. oryzae]RBB19630.1 hypothetical protein BRO13_12060 [Xanthomonas oryzae pv. oryzae]RBB26153.1 hypothetical protein BRO04_10850 [Xanthomonas oryzae pv. oryzae]
MPPHSEQIVSRICGALFRGSLKDFARDLSGERYRAPATTMAGVRCGYAMKTYNRDNPRAIRVTACCSRGRLCV